MIEQVENHGIVQQNSNWRDKDKKGQQVREITMLGL